jgi:hypothetical protein
MNMAIKDGKPEAEADRLLVNSYMGRHVIKKPAYWSKILRMLYGKGRLRTYAGAVEDICEKFSFLLLARDQIVDLENQTQPDKRFHIKYFSYTFVFMEKSFLDSIAVFINEIYKIGFRGGGIDLNKGKFLRALREADTEIGKAIGSKQKWIDYVVKYRNNLIHRHGLYIGAIPTIPENMDDPVEQNNYIMQEHSYMPINPDDTEDELNIRQEGEFIKVTCLVDDWLKESLELFDIVLRSFAFKFELQSVVDSNQIEPN